MMKLINRLLIIAVIAFGAWFIIQHWDSVNTSMENNDTEKIVLEEGEEDELAIDMDIDSPISFDEQLAALEDKTLVKPTTIKKPNDKYIKETPTPIVEKETSKFVFQEKSKVTVYLFDGGIDLSNSTIPMGHVTFTVRNDGRVSHDFSVEGVQDFGRITPGTMHTFELDLTEGEYVLSSPRELDQRLDMRETLRVGNTQ